MLEDARQFYKIDETLSAFRSQVAKFGTFPLPTENTVLAGETLRRSLVENGAPAAGAVCVVELRSAKGLIFLTVASGGGIIADNVVQAWQASLRPLLESSLMSVQCMGIDTAALFYSPAHVDTVNFIKAVFPGFALPAAPLDNTNLQTALQDFTALPTGELGMDYRTSQQVNNLTPVVTAVQQLLAVAVALRINAYDSANAVAARQAISSFRATQKKHFAYAGREELVENIEALALRGGNPYQFAYKEDPNKAISTVKKVQAKLAEAWRVADLNRFCAEPKVLNYIKTHGLRDPVAGQLAMWWDTSRENRYGFAGSEKSPYSDYMLPCSSCQARSGEMMAGVLQTVLAQAEEPIAHVAKAPQMRPRSASFSS
jgi:hypothetical protein